MDLEEQTIEGYKFVERLGSGAVGEVWKVMKDGEEFAIKFIHMTNKQVNDAAEMEKSFVNHSSLRCPFLVKYISTFTNKKNTILYLVMEYCSKGDLSELIREIDASKGIILNENRLLKIITQLLLGVDELHRNRILHRDIKAENVFINAADDIKLGFIFGDFGCGKILESTKRQTVAYVGTCYYMAPEVCEGIPYSYAADIWSLGVLFYTLCAGRYPFEGANEIAIAMAIIKGKYNALPKKLFAPALCALIDSMLQLNPKKRPPVHDLLSNVRSLSKVREEAEAEKKAKEEAEAEREREKQRQKKAKEEAEAEKEREKQRQKKAKEEAEAEKEREKQRQKKAKEEAEAEKEREKQRQKKEKEWEKERQRKIKEIANAEKEREKRRQKKEKEDAEAEEGEIDFYSYY